MEGFNKHAGDRSLYSDANARVDPRAPRGQTGRLRKRRSLNPTGLEKLDPRRGRMFDPLGGSNFPIPKSFKLILSSNFLFSIEHQTRPRAMRNSGVGRSTRGFQVRDVFTIQELADKKIR